MSSRVWMPRLIRSIPRSSHVLTTSFVICSGFASIVNSIGFGDRSVASEAILVTWSEERRDGEPPPI